MSGTEILKLQDKNGDGLIDICEIALPRDEQVCLECKPNPKALVPQWRTRDVYSPFLNERNCMFQITYTTPYTSTGGEAANTPEEAEEILEERFDRFAEDAIIELLNYYNKEETPDTISLLLEDIEYTEYDLDATPLSHLKLLYSVPFDTLNQLDDAEEEEEEEEVPGEDLTVSYIPNQLQRDLIRVRKGLRLYESNLKVYRAMDGKNLLFEDGGVFNLENYGDYALFGSSTMARINPELSSFFRQHGFTLGPGSMFFPNRDSIHRFEVTFSPEFEIKKIKIYSEACREKATTIGRKKLKVLNNRQAFKDPTAMAYFARISKMERDLTARRPKPWVDFLVQYTYPTIFDTATKPPQELSAMGEALSCAGEALADEAKVVGQLIMDEVFSVGDAVAAQFHKMLCEEDYREVLLTEYVMGKGDDDGTRDKKKAAQAKRRSNIKKKALEQAYKELEDKNIIMTGLCARLLTACGPGFGQSQARFDGLWLYTLDPLRLCGLFDMMNDLLKCLMKGMTFEEMIASILSAAFKAMSIENFGDLFAGLPPDKQAKLDALVKRRLASGDISGPGKALDNTSNAIESGEGPSEPPFFGSFQIKKPWNDAALVAKQNAENMVDSPMGSETMAANGIPSGGEETSSQLSQATYTAQMSDPAAGLSPTVVMEAYVICIIEMYAGDLMSLVEILNGFPGAELIAKIIATFDCPRPPLFDPSIADFLKDLQLPFCRNVQQIGLPRMDNPFAWIPKLMDIMRLMWYIAKEMIKEMVNRIICKLMIYLCEKISDAICKAIEMAGSLAAAAVSGGRTTFADVIKDSLCGPGASDQKVEDTIADLFEQIGQGGAEAVGDRQSLMNFVEDLSSTTTQHEMMSAVMGEPSSTFLNVVETLAATEHPQFQAMFPNGDQVGSFFRNIGNMMPLDAREAARDVLDEMPEDNGMPANPTLCATQEDIDNFCAVRAGILEGRASPEQIRALCDQTRDTFRSDFEQVQDIMQGGVPAFIENNMPPIISEDPTCNDGLVPFEPDVIAAAATSAMGGTLEILQIAYAHDMLGNGPGRNNWGFVNMILSDTMGNPYTTHLRKSFNSGGWFTKKKYVDFYVDTPKLGAFKIFGLGRDDDDDPLSNFAKPKRQRGAFPTKVAGYLQTEMESAFKDANFKIKNTGKDDKVFNKTFDDLDIGGLFDDVDLTELPNFGYNVTVKPKYSDKKMQFIRKARKKDYDLRLQYKDRAYGRTDGDAKFLYGFDVELYTNDIIEEDGQFYNRPDDNARIIIRKKINTKYKGPGDDELKEDAEEKGKDDSEKKILKYAAYEFLSTDDGLNLNSDEFEENNYNEFLQAIESPVSSTPPQIILLNEMISNQNGGAPDLSSIKTTLESFSKKMIKEFGKLIYENHRAFYYGATFDNITGPQTDYGMRNPGGTGAENGFQMMKDYLDDEDIDPRDAPFGMSRMQHDEEYNNGPKNRVFYLHPSSYGGRNISPPVHLKPAEKEGWLAIVDAMFPEMSPCKPNNTNLVDFGQIQDIITQTYNKIPEDKRLKFDPDCVTEKPYNRILERSSKAGIEGLIHAACRIFASQHFLKSLATFTVFKPDFRTNFSSLYAAYIVEVMEEELKDAQPSAFAEGFNTFKDDEFWYAFLEQSVQTYARKVADGDVTPSASVVRVLEKLEEFEKNYNWPRRPRLKKAKELKETGPFKTLKNYRYERNLEAIKESEDLAKLILKEFVIDEMDYMSEIFMSNLANVGLVDPTLMINNLDYYILQDLSVNTSLDLHKEIKEEVVGLATEGEDLYTNGDELSDVDTGEPYTGYYHVHQDEETGDPVYMVGSFHTEEDHGMLRPFANKLVVPIGSIGPLGDTMGSESTPFVVESYIKVNSTYYTPDEGKDVVLANDPSLNISDVYPGTMTVDRDQAGEPIGLSGELGVRYGLRLSFTAGGQKWTVVETEIDALDLPIGQFQPLEPNSKLLFCLINNLIDEEKYKMLTSYIVPTKKILATMAIYNDLGFIPSIGQNTKEMDGVDEYDQKPGMYVQEVTEDGEVILGPSGNQLKNDDGSWVDAEERWPGWWKGNGFFGLHFDKWDRRNLSKSKPRLKRLFKNYYNQRDFDAGDPGRVGQTAIAGMTEAFRFSPGERHFPWFKKFLLRSNPFDKNGNMCKK